MNVALTFQNGQLVNNEFQKEAFDSHEVNDILLCTQKSCSSIPVEDGFTNNAQETSEMRNVCDFTTKDDNSKP